MSGCGETWESLKTAFFSDLHSEEGTLSVLRTYHPDDIKTLDPAVAYDGISLDVVPSIYETLYQLDYLSEEYRVVPLLAADLPQFSADRLSLTIPIRRGIRFADDPCFQSTLGKGREVTAHDFTYSLKRLAQSRLKSEGWWLFAERIEGLKEFRELLDRAPPEKRDELLHKGVISGFQAIDDYTLRIRLRSHTPQLLSLLTLTFTAATPFEAAEAYQDRDGHWSRNPVGSGPFRLTEWKRSRRLVLERNPDYHADFYPTEASVRFREWGLLKDSGKPLPFLDRIVIEVLPEPEYAWQRMQSGLLDRMGLGREQASELLLASGELRKSFKDKGYEVTSDLGTRVFYLEFNLKDPLLGTNRALRQAISTAIRREDVIEAWSGHAEKMLHALPPGVLDRPKEPRLLHDYDINRAKALLAQAGFPEGRQLPVLTLDLRGADSASRQVGEVLARQLAAIGVKLNVQTNSLPLFLRKLEQGETQIAFSAWGLDYPDAENIFQLLASRASVHPKISSEYDQLYQRLKQLPNGTERTQIAQKLDTIIQEEAPWVYLFVHRNFELAQPWLKNMRTTELINNRYKYLRVDRDLRRKLRDQRGEQVTHHVE
jgi:oligopeptide transport system substrate-binding protein